MDNIKLDKLILKITDRISVLRENKANDKSGILYPYDFDIKNQKEFLSDLIKLK